MSKKKIPEYMKPSKVITRKMTPEELADMDKTALQGLKNIYSKYNLNDHYGKDDMPEIKEHIDELERAIYGKSNRGNVEND